MNTNYSVYLINVIKSFLVKAHVLKAFLMEKPLVVDLSHCKGFLKCEGMEWNLEHLDLKNFS